MILSPLDKRRSIGLTEAAEALNRAANGASADADKVVAPLKAHVDSLPEPSKEEAAKEFLIVAEEKTVGGQLGRPSGARFRTYERLKRYSEAIKGTLFDTLAGATDPERVAFQIDVFHAFHGGADPAKLIDRYKSRVVSLHLKDLKKGVPVKTGTATAPADVDVPVGAGQIEMPSVLEAARRAGTKLYYIEDESADPWAHIPQSIEYLKNVRS